MPTLFAWGINLLFLYVIVRILYSFFVKKRFPPGHKRQETVRFDAQGKKVEDADFKEL